MGNGRSAYGCTLYSSSPPSATWDIPPAHGGRARQEVDFIAAEDTRVSIKLLNHLGIRKPMVSYYRHNTEAGGQAVLQWLLSGVEL